MKQKKRILVAITFLIVVLVLWCFRSQVQSNLEAKQEQKRIDGILAEINDLYIQNDDYQTQREELEKQQQNLHGSAESNRAEIERLRNEYYKAGDDEHIMELICKEVENSPLCGDYTMLNKLKEIAEKRNVDYKLLL